MAAVTFTPVSDHALMVQLGDEISDALTARVQQLDSAIHAAAPQGLLETVPAFVNLMITFDPVVTDHAEMEQAVRALLQEGAAVQVPGAEPASGEVDEPIQLQGGEPATVTLPVALEPAGIDALASRAERVSSLLSLARQLSRRGELPAGSQLSLTPTLPAALDGIVTAPTLILDIGEQTTSAPDTVPVDG